MTPSLPPRSVLLAIALASGALAGCNKHDDASTIASGDTAASSPRTEAPLPGSNALGTAGGIGASSAAPSDATTRTRPIPGSDSASAAAAQASNATQVAEALAAPASASPGPLAREDESFLKFAAQSDLFEVQASRLAAERAAGGALKDYAARMVATHGQAGTEAAAIASEHGLQLPTAAAPPMKSRIAELERLKGATFDKRYVELVGIEGHQASIAEFEKESARTNDAELKAWVDRTLRTLRDHEAMARQLARGTPG